MQLLRSVENYVPGVKYPSNFVRMEKINHIMMTWGFKRATCFRLEI